MREALMTPENTLPIQFGGSTGHPRLSAVVFKEPKRFPSVNVGNRSSFVELVVFDMENDLLFVTMQASSTVYVYEAGLGLYLDFITRESPGAFYNRNIRADSARRSASYTEADVVSTPRLREAIG